MFIIYVGFKGAGDGEDPSASGGLFNETCFLSFGGFLDAETSGFIRFPAFRTSNSLFSMRKTIVFQTLSKKNMFSEAGAAPRRDSEDLSGQRGTLYQNRYFRFFRFFRFS